MKDYVTKVWRNTIDQFRFCGFCLVLRHQQSIWSLFVHLNWPDLWETYLNYTCNVDNLIKSAKTSNIIKTLRTILLCIAKTFLPIKKNIYLYQIDSLTTSLLLLFLAPVSILCCPEMFVSLLKITTKTGQNFWFYPWKFEFIINTWSLMAG